MNSVMMQGFEWFLSDDGNYYKELSKRAEELARAGISSIWLPPATKATGTNDVGYGVYDLYDLGEFDQKGDVRTKYGTLEELRKCIDVLHDHGIKVYFDVVLNHKAGADFSENFRAVKVDPNNRDKQISDVMEIEGWTGFDFPGRGDQYSDFKWHFQHFSGVDFDQKSGENGIFKILLDDRDWNDDVSTEKGNYDYLMFADIDHHHEDVRQELFRWGKWLIDFLPIDGMRMDAMKHISDDFMEDFIREMEDHLDRDFYFFGEFWQYDPNALNKYMYDTKYHTDLFDVGLHFNLHEASVQGSSFDMRKIFDNTIVQEHRHMAVTFVDNHDTQPGQSLSSFVEPWFKKIAYGLILLREDGYPCVFWGDYYGIGGPDPQKGHQEMIDNLLYIRKNYAYGDETDYFNEPNLIGWVRHGNEDHPGKLVVLISTGDMNELSMNVGKSQSGRTYIEITGENDSEVVIDDEGNGVFQVGPGSLSCWVEKQSE